MRKLCAKPPASFLISLFCPFRLARFVFTIAVLMDSIKVSRRFEERKDSQPPSKRSRNDDKDKKDEERSRDRDKKRDRSPKRDRSRERKRRRSRSRSRETDRKQPKR